MIKSKILKFFIISIILVMGSSSSVSGFANSNSDNDLSSFNNSSEIAQNALGDVLVLYEDVLANVEYAVSGISNYALTFWALGSSNTPVLADLMPYPTIILTSNYAYSDSIGVGNVLADYVDAGGKVIQLSHSFSSGFSILGRFNSSGYIPFWGTIGSTSRTYDNLSTHPIFTGVTSFNTIHSFNAVPTLGSQVIASYSDGEPLMAIKGSVVAMNAYVGLSVGGDLGLILDNAIDFLLSPNVLVLYEDALTNTQYAVSGISNYKLDFWALGSSNTPVLANLTPYPAIILTSNYAYSDSIGVGNVLADYVDAGGRVIQLSHSFSSGYSILGRFNSSGYMPFWGTIGSTSRTYDNLSTHPIFTGVASFSTIHSFNAVPTSGAQVIASYSDGEPLMAIKGSVVAMNAYVGLSVGGDLGIILDNAIDFLLSPNVLVLYEDNLTNTQYAVSGISNYKLDFWALGSSNTPVLADLMPYPIIILTSNYAYSDSIGVGNVLADYVDAGGKVIQLSHSFSSGYSILGRFNSSGYMPFWGTIGSTSRTYDNLSTHPIFEGVTSFNTIHSFNAVPTLGSQVIASYSDGEPLMAIKGSVVAMNAYVGLSVGGDLGLILENSIKFLIPEDPQDTIPPTITGPVELLVELGDPSSQVQWLMTDEGPGSFDIYLNGTFFSTGIWDEFPIEVGIGLEAYTIGTYEFRVDARDTHGNEATMTTLVYVKDTVLPIFTVVPADPLYYWGDLGNVLQWEATDLNPNNYQLLQNDVTIETGLWVSKNTISVSVDGLSIGNYNFTLVIFDHSGNSAVNTVIVTVNDPTISETKITEPSSSISDIPTTSDLHTTTSESTSEDDTTTPELPIPFSNIYLIIFSILGLTMISRKKKY